MTPRRNLLRRVKLRNVLLVALLLSGIIPMAISSMLLIPQSQNILVDAERDALIRRAGALSNEVSSYLSSLRRQLVQLGTAVILPPGPPEMGVRLREGWVEGNLQSLIRNSPDVLVVRLFDPSGAGPVVKRIDLSAPVSAALDRAFSEARTRKQPAYSFVDQGPRSEPLAVLAVPIADEQGTIQAVAQALFRFKSLQEVSTAEPGQGVAVFLIDKAGKILWSQGDDVSMQQALLKSEMLRNFVSKPLNLQTRYEYTTPKGVQEVLAQVSAIEEPGWGVVVQKPLDTAFAVINTMIYRAVLATLLLVALSLFFAFVAARWVGQPIQRLTETSHEIAAGSFGGRVEVNGLSFELSALAEDFNRMSGHLESYVEQLRQAAQANRDLFIGSLRAFVAAIDAKDPYTRGHSERVASVSRTIARHLALPEEVQHKVWIGALLHDVGKIGVEDYILRKDGVLTAEEYEQMKMHTTIGAEIMAPIEQLREVIPAIRFHHEGWNGRGYPDGLKGDQIPLFARIVAVADTFDAITTNRPYQQAYSLQFAVETITKLAGSRFDAKIVTAFLRAFQGGEIRPGGPRPVRSEPSPEAEPRAAVQG